MSRKLQVFICIVVVLCAIAICMCSQLFYLQKAYAVETWYDQGSLELDSGNQANDDFDLTLQIQCELKTTSKGIQNIDAIHLYNNSSNYAVYINSIELESLVESTNLGK